MSNQNDAENASWSPALSFRERMSNIGNGVTFGSIASYASGKALLFMKAAAAAEVVPELSLAAIFTGMVGLGTRVLNGASSAVCDKHVKAGVVGAFALIMAGSAYAVHKHSHPALHAPQVKTASVGISP